jgi:hypothetical protein
MKIMTAKTVSFWVLDDENNMLNFSLESGCPKHTNGDLDQLERHKFGSSYLGVCFHTFQMIYAITHSSSMQNPPR